MPRTKSSAAAWWFAVAAYTAMLPGAITVWRGLVGAFGRTGAGYVPALLISATAVFVVRRALVRRVEAQGWWLLATAAVICVILLATAALPSKRIHVPEYLLLAWMTDRALRASGGVPRQRLWVALLTATLGGIDETLQGLIPGRYFSLLDALMNAAAGAAGAMILAAASPLPAVAPRPAGSHPAPVALALFLAAAAALGGVQYLVLHAHSGLENWPVWAATSLAAGIAGGVAAAIGCTSPAARALGLACAAVLVLLGGGGLAGVEFR